MLARPELQNTPARELDDISPGAARDGAQDDAAAAAAFMVEARNSGYDVMACDVRTGLMPRDCMVTEGERWLPPTVWMMGGVSQGSSGREEANCEMPGEEGMGSVSVSLVLSTFSWRRHLARLFWNHT